MTMSAGEQGQPRLHPNLSRLQGFALIEEASSARNLLRDAIAAIRRLRFVCVEGDAIFTLGSIGVEKTMKVLLGCHHVDTQGSWPSRAVQSLQWGHDIDGMRSHLDAVIENGLADCAYASYAEDLAQRISRSPLLPPLFSTFTRYGRSGRFHHLDTLSDGKQGAYEAPSDYWERVEQQARDTYKDLGTIPSTDIQALEDFLPSVRNRIADEVARKEVRPVATDHRSR